MGNYWFILGVLSENHLDEMSVNCSIHSHERLIILRYNSRNMGQWVCFKKSISWTLIVTLQFDLLLTNSSAGTILLEDFITEVASRVEVTRNRTPLLNIL